MARTGSFGRLPRALPTLTSTLIAIAREQERQRDQNIMDAWMKGGTFEGKKVTDDLMLAHWRQRLNGIAKDDPLYDTYKNAVLQYEYSIAESKMTMRYAQERVSDSQMANFYLNWAKKVPQDSEFYRILQRDAAQYMRAAKSKAEASARQREAEAYDRRMRGYEQQQGPAKFILSILTTGAQQGISGMANSSILPETALGGGMSTNINQTTNIGDTPVTATEKLLWISSMIGEQGYYSAGRGGIDEAANNVWLFTDDQGKRWTRGEVVAQLKANDPTWDGRLTPTYVAEQLGKQTAILDQAIAHAESTGHASDAARLRQQKSAVVEQQETIAATPVMTRYAAIKRRIEEIKFNGGYLPAVQDRLIRAELAKIGKLADDPSIANDGKLQSQLRGEAALQPGTVSAWEDWTGTRGTGSTPDAVTPGTAERTEVGSLAAFLANTAEITKAVNEGAVMTRGERVEDGMGGVVFQPMPNGTQWGITDQDLTQLPGGDKASVVMIPNGDGSGVTPVTLIPRPVFASFADPELTGKIAVENKEPIGWYIDFPSGSQNIRLYRIEASDGSFYFSAKPQWDEKIEPVKNKDGSLTVNLAQQAKVALANSGPDRIPGDEMGGRFAIEGSTGAYVEGRVSGQWGTVDANGNPVYAAGSGEQGTVIINPQEFVAGTNPERAIVGFDPTTDSPSPTIAAAKGMADGGNEFMSSVVNNPLFRTIVEFDTMRASNVAADEMGLPILTDANRGAYDRYKRWTDMATDTSEPLRDSHLSPDAWKSITAAEPPGATSPKGSRFDIDRKRATGALPLDVLRDQRDERFAAMYNTNQPGTNIIKPPAAPDSAMAIKAGQPLVLPQVGFKLPGPTGPLGGGGDTSRFTMPNTNTNTQTQTQTQTQTTPQTRTSTKPRML